MIPLIRPDCGRAAGLALLVLPLATPAQAGEHLMELGVRANAMYVSHSLADGMLGGGIILRYHVREHWFVAFSLDSYRYEITDPLGLDDNPRSPIVVPLRTSVFSTAIGKSQQLRDSGVDWFWHAGLGVGIPAAGNSTGNTASGAAFDLHTEAGAEIHLSATLGASLALARQWALVAAVRAEHHFVDLQITDDEGGESRVVDSFSPVGVFVSLNYRF